MRFSERSRICLIPRRHAPANPFGGDPIACNLLLSPENRMRFSGDRGDKSEIRVAGRGKRQIQRIWTFGFAIYALVPPENRMRFSGGTGSAKILSHEWVGKKNPPGAPIGDRAPRVFLSDQRSVKKS